MTRRFALLAVLALAGCEEGITTAATGGGGSSGQRELMVLGSNMSFAECQRRGGLIIRDANTPMVACDPRVVRAPTPSDEEEFVRIEEAPAG